MQTIRRPPFPGLFRPKRAGRGAVDALSFLGEVGSNEAVVFCIRASLSLSLLFCACASTPAASTSAPPAADSGLGLGPEYDPKLGDQGPMAFSWKPGCTVPVQKRTSIQGVESTEGFELRVESHPEGLLIRETKPTPIGAPNSDDNPGREDIVVSSDGVFVEAPNAAKGAAPALEKMSAMLATMSESQKAEIVSILNDGKIQKLRWDLWVGDWLGLNLKDGQHQTEEKGDSSLGVGRDRVGDGSFGLYRSRIYPTKDHMVYRMATFVDRRVFPVIVRELTGKPQPGKTPPIESTSSTAYTFLWAKSAGCF